MTITLDLAARIERLYTVEHWRVGTIARQLHVHRDTVRRVLREHAAVAPGVPLRRYLVDPYRPFILETLEKYPTLTASRLHDMVRERGYAGQASHFRHLVASMRPRPPAEAYLRLRTLAGEQAQVDWGLCRARHRPHTTAMDLLQAGVDTTVIAMWLGHESVETTHVYLNADLELKRRVLAKTIPPDSNPSTFRPDDALLTFLKNL